MNRILVGIASLSITAAAGCGEYEHSNPYEPSARVNIVISGPDTISSRGNGAFYTYSSDPVMPDVSPAWSSGDPTVLQNFGTLADGSGHFFPAKSGAVTISVGLGPHVQTKRVVIVLAP